MDELLLDRWAKLDEIHELLMAILRDVAKTNSVDGVALVNLTDRVRLMRDRAAEEYAKF